MGMEQGIICLTGVCIIILLIAGWRRKKAVLRNFLLRLVTGMALITVVNYLLGQGEIDVTVGMNLFSLMAAGTLGVPGVAMLYGIAGCKFL